MTFRMARTIEASPSAKPALTVIQNLSELRLTHARLLEEHGSTIALLRTREAEQRRAETALSEAQSIITSLKAEVHSLEDTKTRWEQQAKLAEREVGGLKALVVCVRALLPAYLISSLRQAMRLKREHQISPLRMPR